MSILTPVLLGWLALAGWQSDPCARASALVADARAVAEDAVGLAKKRELYREAIALCPDHAEAHNNLGDTYEKLQRWDEAIAAYLRAIQAKPGWALPYFGLGDVHRKTGRPDDALYWYRRGSDFDPANEETLGYVRELTADDPPGVVGSRSIAPILEATRGPGVMESIAFDERLIPFDFDSAVLKPGARAQIREIAHALWDVLGVGTRGPGVLISAGAVVLEVAGHTDSRGTEAYNEDLGRRRAEAVIDEVVREYRVPRSRLRATSYGESRLICRDDTEACHARNRRVEIRRP